MLTVELGGRWFPGKLGTALSSGWEAREIFVAQIFECRRKIYFECRWLRVTRMVT